MKNVSDQLLKMLEDRDYAVANAIGIAAQWIATKYYTHYEKNASLVDLYIISKLNTIQSPQAMNQVADDLDRHCSVFMSEVKNEFDRLKTSDGNNNSHILQTLKKLIPNLETRKIKLPMYKTIIHRIDKKVCTFQVNPIILIDDVGANSLDFSKSSREWLVAFGDHKRYKMYVVPIGKFEKFLDTRAELAKETVKQLSDGEINRLTKPLSISQKVLAILGCVWGLIALDIILKTNIIPLDLYWSNLLIASLAALMGTIALIAVGGIKFRKIHEDRFILQTESHQVLQPSIIGEIGTDYSRLERQSPLSLSRSSTKWNLDHCLRDFEKNLKEAKLDFENKDFNSFFVKAQSALYSALKAKYFELTNRSPGILSFTQLVNILRKNGFSLPSDKEIGKWADTTELALPNRSSADFKIARDYLFYLSRFISSLRPLRRGSISHRLADSKTKEEIRRRDLISNTPTQI